jgi:pimeloyl-ACP methyl ester carboxylesterase
MWHYCESGAGQPLILLHGIGMSHAAWSPVISSLRQTRRVIAFDIAGFGATPPLPRGVPPTVGNLVDGLEQSLRELRLPLPLDIAGNSLGGAMALEAARRGLARTVVAISPIGLWDAKPPAHVAAIFAVLRAGVRAVPTVLKVLLSNPFLRECLLAVPLSAGSRRMPARDAWRSVDDLAAAGAFEDTFECSCAPYDGTAITVPVTVAFGRRDWVLTRRARRRDRLPAATWIEPDKGGHVPMWADPIGVAGVILTGTAAASSRIQ